MPHDFLLKGNSFRATLLKSRGLTLIELIICLMLLAFLYCFSIKVTSDSYENNQLLILKNDLQEAIRFARIQALAEGVPLALMPSSKTCDWSNGIVLFEDNHAHVLKPDTHILRYWDWSKLRQGITWHGFQSSCYLSFSTEINHSALNGYFMIQDKTHTTKLIVNRVGRVRIE